MFATLDMEIIALAGVFALGFYMVFETDPAQWWRERMQGWVDLVHAWLPRNQNITWLVAAGLPALAVGLLDAAINSIILHFLLSAATLMLGLRISSFVRYHNAIIKAVYANDDQTAINLANEWEGRDDGLEDSRSRFVPRMLSLCTRRLCEDVIAGLLWFVLLGPAGVILAATSVALFDRPWAKPVSVNPLQWLPDACATALIGVSGNLAQVIQARSLRPEQAALVSGGIDPDNISLDKVPAYGNMLIRAMFIGAGASVALLI